MKTSPARDMLPKSVRHALVKLGMDIGAARRKRGLTMAMMMERIGIAKTTYIKLEKGDPAVAMGTYAMALFVLGLDGRMTELADAKNDETGLLLDAGRIPKRVRTPKQPTAS